MILVAGGQLDPNIGALLRQMLRRKIAFRDLLIGPELHSEIVLDFQTGRLVLNGAAIEPSACFVRHDVFLGQALNRSGADAGTVSLNWFYAIRGWLNAQSKVRGFNKRASGSENNKIANLLLARKLGFRIPDTVVSSHPDKIGDQLARPAIQKPVAGGALTTTLDDFLTQHDPAAIPYPRFFQPQLQRPELRLYRIGERLFGFWLESPDLDYREHHNAQIRPAEIPAGLARRMIRLSDALGCDFAAADFMHQPGTDRLCFLEINTQPMFAAFDKTVDGGISDAIIDYLLGESSAAYATVD